MKVGSMISSVATPIAGWLGMDCYDPITGTLRPESKCAQTVTRLDAAQNPREFAQAIFDRFRSDEPKGDNMADEKETKKSYLVVVLVDTEKLSNIDVKAIEAASKGEVLAVNPQQPKPQVQFGVGTGGEMKVSPQGQTIIRGTGQPG